MGIPQDVNEVLPQAEPPASLRAFAFRFLGIRRTYLSLGNLEVTSRVLTSPPPKNDGAKYMATFKAAGPLCPASYSYLDLSQRPS
jgi:hypothetical protein